MPFGYLPGRSSVDVEVVLIAIAIALATALPVLFVVLRNWLFGRRLQRGRTVRLEFGDDYLELSGRTVRLALDGDYLELSDTNSEQQARLLDIWLKHRQDLDKEGEESGDR